MKNILIVIIGLILISLGIVGYFYFAPSEKVVSEIKKITPANETVDNFSDKNQLVENVTNNTLTTKDNKTAQLFNSTSAGNEIINSKNLTSMVSNSSEEFENKSHNVDNNIKRGIIKKEESKKYLIKLKDELKLASLSKDKKEELNNLIIKIKSSQQVKRRGKIYNVKFKDSNLKIKPAKFTGDFEKDVIDVLNNLTIKSNTFFKVYNFAFDDYKSIVKSQQLDFVMFVNKIKEFSYNINKIVIIGYTDNIGTEEYNLYLSIKRAEFGGNYLKDKFKDKLVMIGAGESMPIAPNSTREGRSKNRRMEIYLYFK